MAQKIVMLRTDDITGKDIPEGDGETIRFAVNGVEYEIDLDAKNTKKFHEAIGFYVDHGRKLGRGGGTPSRRSSRSARSAPEVDTGAVRAWAAEQGIKVSTRGRIKQEIVEQYQAAQR